MHRASLRQLIECGRRAVCRRTSNICGLDGSQRCSRRTAGTPRRIRRYADGWRGWFGHDKRSSTGLGYVGGEFEGGPIDRSPRMAARALPSREASRSRDRYASSRHASTLACCTECRPTRTSVRGGMSAAGPGQVRVPPRLPLPRWGSSCRSPRKRIVPPVSLDHLAGNPAVGPARSCSNSPSDTAYSRTR
jgi:hypothetical protein